MGNENECNALRKPFLKRKRPAAETDGDSRKKRTRPSASKPDEPIYNLQRCNATVGLENQATNNKNPKRSPNQWENSLVRCNATIGMNDTTALPKLREPENESTCDSKDVWTPRPRMRVNPTNYEKLNAEKANADLLVRSNATIGMDMESTEPSLRVRMRLLPGIYKKPNKGALKESKQKTKLNLAKSEKARRSMPKERLKKLEAQIQEWNSYFKTHYTLL